MTPIEKLDFIYSVYLFLFIGCVSIVGGGMAFALWLIRPNRKTTSKRARDAVWG